MTNPGSVPDRLFEPVAGDGADVSWCPVEEPVGAGGSVSYQVKILVPAGPPAAM